MGQCGTTTLIFLVQVTVALQRTSYEIPHHRVITIIVPQRLVVLGSTALFTMVGQLRIHDDREEGWDNLLFE